MTANAFYDDLNDELETAFGEVVTYARNGVTKSVTAVWNAGRQGFDIKQSALSATFTEPKQGDTITRSDGSIYDVSLEYTDESGLQLPDYDIADGAETIWSIHVQPVQSV